MSRRHGRYQPDDTPIPAWQILTTVEGHEVSGAEWALSPRGDEYTRRAQKALEAGYLTTEVSVGPYNRRMAERYVITPKGIEYVIANRPNHQYP